MPMILGSCDDPFVYSRKCALYAKTLAALVKRSAVPSRNRKRKRMIETAYTTSPRQAKAMALSLGVDRGQLEAAEMLIFDHVLEEAFYFERTYTNPESKNHPVSFGKEWYSAFPKPRKSHNPER